MCQNVKYFSVVFVCLKTANILKTVYISLLYFFITDDGIHILMFQRLVLLKNKYKPEDL